MVEFLHVKRREKRNRTDFYQGIVKVCVAGIQYGATETFCLLKYFNILGSRFAKILKYSKCLSIIFMLNWFKHFDPQKKQSIFYPKKCFNTLRPKYVPRSRMFQYSRISYYWHRLKQGPGSRPWTWKNTDSLKIEPVLRTKTLQFASCHMEDNVEEIHFHKKIRVFKVSFSYK